jgi:RimJ/RimL family protein N-acetyltransferase
MPTVRLRPYTEEDAALADAQPQDPEAVEFLVWRPPGSFRRRLAANGLMTEDQGNLAIDVEGVGYVGDVGWFAVHHGPGTIARALNIGIEVLAEHRYRGYGTVAQRLIAEHLFQTTLVERLEASTDIDNLAEQRALEKAGYVREGVLRHAWFRAGAWRDCVLYSRLRSDPRG